MIGNYVYIIGNRQKRVFKIGMSNNVEERLKMLQTGSPYRLEVIYTCQCDNPRMVEKELHDQFSNYRLSGEWFDLPGRVLRLVINRLRIHQIEAIKTNPPKKHREHIKDRLARMLAEMPDDLREILLTKYGPAPVSSEDNTIECPQVRPGHPATLPEAIAFTNEYGDWFDGFTKEDTDDDYK